MWEEFVHTIYDLFYLFQWLLGSLQNLFVIVFRPFTWIFNFGKGFLNTALSTPEQLGLELPPIANFTQSVFSFFEAIPYINLIFAGVGAVLGILVLFFIVKKLIHI